MLRIAIAPRLEAADQQVLTDAQVLALMLRGGNRPYQKSMIATSGLFSR